MRLWLLRAPNCSTALYIAVRPPVRGLLRQRGQTRVAADVPMECRSAQFGARRHIIDIADDRQNPSCTVGLWLASMARCIDRRAERVAGVGACLHGGNRRASVACTNEISEQRARVVGDSVKRPDPAAPLTASIS